MNCPACKTAMTQPNPNRPDWWQCTCGLADTEHQLLGSRRRRTRTERADDAQPAPPANPLRRSGLRKERLAELAQVICPRCTCAGHLVETVPPTKTHSGHYACRGAQCGWEGPGKALKPGQTEEQANKKQVLDRWGTATDREVAEVMRPKKSSKKGGGGGSKAGRKKDANKGSKTAAYRLDRAEQEWSRNRGRELKHVVNVPGVDRPAEVMRDAMTFYLGKRAAQG